MRAHRVARWLALPLPALLVALGAALAGCAHFGVPDVPPPAESYPPGTVFVAHHPYTVLGFGHTGVIVPAAGGVLRFDQYASAELAYGQRLSEGRAWFWEGLTARLPSIFGLTRERVIRRHAPSPAEALEPGELLLPISGLDAAAVRRAAEARHERAAMLESPTASRYFWTANNCQHFLRDVLRAGGPIHERYFPKHFVADYLSLGPPAPDAGGRGEGLGSACEGSDETGGQGRVLGRDKSGRCRTLTGAGGDPTPQPPSPLGGEGGYGARGGRTGIDPIPHTYST